MYRITRVESYLNKPSLEKNYMNRFNELMNSYGEIEKEGIKKIIPYKEPFLFIDKIMSLSNNRIAAIKGLTGDEEFFKGHFVDFPIMPGALTVEGLGQVSTLLIRSNLPNHQEKDVLAYKLKEVKFMAPIFPGDTIKFVVDLIAQDERGAILQGKAFVKDNLVAEALLMLAIVNKSEFRARYK